MEITPILVFNTLVLVIFTVAFFYQLVYVFVVLARRHVPYRKAERLHRYAFVVCAHNEGLVIGDLIDSIRAQDYPAELVDAYVFCDNCSDDTADVAREHGAVAYERPAGGQHGKSWVMDYGLRRIAEESGKSYDGYFVFDADNVVAPDYVTEMNNVFDEGCYAAVTSYRNSKNFDSSWVSRAYGLWFMREATYLNNARMILGTSCAVSGTGYLVSARIVQAMGGWDFHLLTEDIQFSTFCAVRGLRIGYAHKAMFYDEQPITFAASWRQRLRWTKGFYQVFVKYGPSLVRGIGGRSRNFAAYDLLMTIAPGMVLTLVSASVNGIYLLVGLVFPSFVSSGETSMCLWALAMTFLSMYCVFFVLALLTTATEHANMHASALHKVSNLFTFPVFMLSYVPIALVAAVKKVDWVPTRHTISKSLSDITSER